MTVFDGRRVSVSVAVVLGGGAGAVAAADAAHLPRLLLSPLLPARARKEGPRLLPALDVGHPRTVDLVSLVLGFVGGWGESLFVGCA